MNMATLKKRPVLKKKETADLVKEVEDNQNEPIINDISYKPFEGNSELVVSTGSTLLDLAISGNRIRGGGIPAGILVEVFGPSGSGKTAIIAEICGSAQKRGGEVNFTDPEARLDQEYTQIYGVSLEKDFFNYSRPDTVTELITTMQDWKPESNEKINVFAGDSVAALSTNMEMEDGDKMGMRRAKEFSEGLRKVCRKIRKENWVVAFSNQVRQGQGNSYVTPGGMAVPFYASLRIQIGPDPTGGKIKKKTKLSSGKEVTAVTGINSICTIIKSSIDVPFRSAPISIIFNYGIDDIRQNLQYCKDMLNETKYDAVTKQFVSLESAISYVEENDLEEQLRDKTIDLWESIQKELKIDRKPKGRV